MNKTKLKLNISSCNPCTTKAENNCFRTTFFVILSLPLKLFYRKASQERPRCFSTTFRHQALTKRRPNTRQQLESSLK